jgi:hypothetical protein
MPPNPASPPKLTNPTKPGVTINIRVPMALHRQLRLQALRQDMMMKDAVVEAIKEWVAPTRQHAQVSELDLDQVRAEAMRELATLVMKGQGAEALALLNRTEDAAGLPRTQVEEVAQESTWEPPDAWEG